MISTVLFRMLCDSDMAGNHHCCPPARCVATVFSRACLCCLCGGLPTIHYNELHDITAGLLTEICHNVAMKLSLQPLSGGSFQYRSANIEEMEPVSLYVAVNGFWECS